MNWITYTYRADLSNFIRDSNSTHLFKNFNFIRKFYIYIYVSGIICNIFCIKKFILLLWNLVS